MMMVKHGALDVNPLVFDNAQDSSGQLCNLIYLTLFKERTWIRYPLSVSFNLNYFVMYDSVIATQRYTDESEWN